MNNDKKIQSSAKSKSFMKRCLALLTCVGMLGSFMMPYQGVLPVIAEGEGNNITVSSPVTVLSKDSDTSGDVFQDASKDSPRGDAYPLDERVDALTVGNIKYTKGQEVPVVVETSPYELRVKLGYSFTQKQLEESGILAEDEDGNPLHPYLTYLISVENFSMEKEKQYGATCTVMDGDRLAGYYSLNKNGRLNIKLTKDYIDYLKTQSQGCIGNVELGGTVTRDATEKGDKTVTVAGFKINVDFPDTMLGFTKSQKSYDKTDNKITWEINLTNPQGYIDLSTATITDVLTAGDSETNIAAGNIESCVTDPVNIFTLDSTTGKFTYTGGDDNKHLQNVKITYVQKNPESNVKYKNKAQAVWSKTKSGESNSAEFTIANQLNVTKSAKPDYMTGTPNNVMKWVVTVENAMGNPLKAVTVDDSMDLTADNITSIKNVATGEALVSGADYSIADGNVVFTSDIAAAKVEICYSTNIESYFNGDTSANAVAKIPNTVTAHSDDTTLTEGSVTINPEYKHSFTLTKDSSGGLTSKETETIQWKIVARTDYGANSLASLDGYIIEDDAFKGRDVSSSGTAGENITYNAYYVDSNGVEQNMSSYVSIVKDGDNKVKISVNASAPADRPVNRIVFFYNQSFEKATYDTSYHNVSNEWDGKGNSYDDYKAGNKEVRMVNTAKGQNSDGTIVHGDVTGEYKAKMNLNSWKDYVSASVKDVDENNNEILIPLENKEAVMGDEDVRLRILTWRINVEREGGIKAGDVVVADVIQFQNDNNNIHYITPSQAGNIKVYAGTDSENCTLLDSGYEIVYYDCNVYGNMTGTKESHIIENFASQTEKNAVCFEVKITSEQSVGKYVKVEYDTTADVSKISSNQSVTFHNESKVNDGNWSQKWGFVFTRENPETVKTFNLKFKKSWNDESNYRKLRPEKVQFKVYQTTENPEEVSSPVWVQYPDENTIYEMATDNNNENAYQVQGLPQWKVETVEEKKVAKRYYYKIEELPVANYKVDSENSTQWVYANNGDEKTFGITNNLNANANKTAIDSNEKKMTSMTYNQLSPVTINDAEYYVFRWKVEDLILKGENTITYTDTLPAGAIILNQDPYKMRIRYWGSNEYNASSDNTVITPPADGAETNQWTISLKSSANESIRWFTYYTAIPVNSFESSLADGKFTNSIQKGEEPPVNASITMRENEPEEQAKMTKGYEPSAVKGSVKYYLDVNKQGLNLSNNDYINITDRLRQDNNVEGVGLTLDDVVVYPLVNDEADESNPITDFTYTVGYDVVEDLSFNVTTWEGYNHSWKVTGWNRGDTITVTANQSDGKGINAWLVFFSIEEPSSVDDWRISYTAFQAYENGKSTLTAKIPDNCKCVAVVDWTNGGDTVSDIVCSGKSGKIPAVLNMTVPDEQPLRIEYTYRVSGYPEYEVQEHQYSSEPKTPHYYEVSGFSAGDKITMLINKTNAGKALSDDVYYWFAGSGQTISNAYPGYVPYDGVKFSGADDKGYSKISGVTVPEGKTRLYIVDLGKIGKGLSEDSVMNAFVAPSVVFTNTASFNEANGSETATSESNEMSVVYSSADISANKHPKIFKTDVNDYSISTLAAQFIVAPKLIQFGSRMIGLKMPILRNFMKSSFSSVSRISARYSPICHP